MRIGRARPAGNSWEQKTGCQNIRKFTREIFGPGVDKIQLFCRISPNPTLFRTREASKPYSRGQWDSALKATPHSP
jgi:hypothetical protein